MSDVNELSIYQDLQNLLVDNIVIIRVGQKAQAFIRSRVQRGEYLPGSTGGAEYSTKPMPVPYGLFVKKLGKAILKKEGTKGSKSQKIIRGRNKVITTATKDEFSVYRSKTGKTMVLIQGGYKRWRELNKLTTAPVAMTWTARMMRNLGIIRSEKMTTEIGFNSESEKMKAYYQHIGAGKNKVTRIFLDLSTNEIDQLADLAEEMILQKLT